MRVNCFIGINCMTKTDIHLSFDGNLNKMYEIGNNAGVECMPTKPYLETVVNARIMLACLFSCFS